MRRLASTLAGRRPFPVEAAIGTTEHESRAWSRSKPNSPGCPIGHRSTQELRLVWRRLHSAGPPVGLSRDLLIRALPMICKSVPMAARAPHSGGACRASPKRPRRRSGRRSRYRAEGRHDPGAAVARTHAHRPRPEGRVRARGRALSLADRHRRADYRGALVGPTVLWPD
jgi:hypothetical protein